jgi:hypothetical protein
MIDKEARDILAENFRHLIAGQITNDQFEDRLRKSRDAGVNEVFFCGAWPLYDDLHEHKLTGRWAIKKEDWPIAARYILFLKTDLEYEWPTKTGMKELPWTILALVTFGLVGKLRNRCRFARSGGDSDVWPFFRTADLEAAKRQHPYLTETKGTPNQASDATSEPAPGAASSSHQG